MAANFQLLDLKFTQNTQTSVYEMYITVTYEIPGLPIYIGNKQSTKIYVGTTEASAVYIGTTKIL